jgi:thiol-disulfide isomerase/thioredoxin
MPYVIAALVLVGGLCALDLLLTFGVLRRLRSHAEILRNRQPMGRFDPHQMAGVAIPEFRATAVDGTVFDRSSLTTREHLVGFFTPRCGPCHEQAPDFARLGADGGRLAPPVLAVIVDRKGTDTELATIFDGLPTISGAEGAALAEKFGVEGFPTLLTTGTDGRIVTSGVSLRTIGQAVPA